VLEYDNIKSKCVEGNCIVLQRVKPISEFTQLIWKKCDVKTKGSKGNPGTTQSFFVEPV